ncbi:hypothetical protein SAMN02745866_03324 [Alteromonadaceae bacterium Bs31]|nr:hypothetical protein SAMN02745866_03324 [Alteromonadaceae bacterium Bs31]
MVIMPILITLALAGVVYFSYLQRLGIARRQLCISFDECARNGSLVNAAAKHHKNPRSYLRVVERLILHTRVPQVLARSFNNKLVKGMPAAEALLGSVSAHMAKYPEDVVYFYDVGRS